MPTSAKDFTRDPNFPIIREFKVRHDMGALMRRHGAHSVGIGPKRVGGKPTKDLALIFYVPAKTSSERLDARMELPKTISFRSSVDRRRRRVRTDVVESPQASFDLDPTDRHRPAPGGVSVGPPTGTLGGWVWDETDDTIVALSNEHVFGSVIGAAMPQPGTVIDGGSVPADTIGTTKRSIVRTTTGINIVDCAIMEPTDDDIYDLVVEEIGPAVYAIDEATLGMEVEKYGRTTQHTYGEVTSVDYMTTLTSGHTFDNCIRVDAAAPSADWSAGGDSGSLVFRQEPTTEGGTIKPVVGLHFAGASTYGIECHIGNVFDQLNLTTLCSGAFANFLESLGGSSESVVSESVVGESLTATGRPSLTGRFAATLTTADLPIAVDPADVIDIGRPQLVGRTPTLTGGGAFTGRLRTHVAALRDNRGLARDVQARLQGTSKGRVLTDAVDTHRGELLTMLARNGDVRRAATAALRPVTAGKVTSSDVLETVIDDDSMDRFATLARTVQRSASPALKAVVEDLHGTLTSSRGRTLGQVFGLR